MKIRSLPISVLALSLTTILHPTGWCAIKPDAAPPPPVAKEPSDGPGAPAERSLTAEEKLAAAGKLPEDPARWMERFLNGLRTDTDHQSASGTRLLEALLAANRWKEGRLVVAEMRDFRKNGALYRLAAAAAKAGDKAAGEEFFAEAEKQAPLTRDFEKDEVMAARALALGAGGKLEAGRKEAEGIKAPDLRMDTLARLFEFVPPATAVGEARKFAADEKAAPSVRGRVLLFAAATMEKAGQAEPAKTLAVEAIETLCKAMDVETIPLFHQAISLLARRQAQAEAARWAEVCLGFAERVDPRAHWKARDMRLSAECLRLGGREEEAQAVLARIPNLTTKLDAISYAKGGMEAASAFLVSGQTELFHKAAGHVLDLTRKHPHHRARAMAAVDVLAAYVRQGLNLPPEVRVRLDETAVSIEQDPQFLNPV